MYQLPGLVISLLPLSLQTLTVSGEPGLSGRHLTQLSSSLFLSLLQSGLQPTRLL